MTLWIEKSVRQSNRRMLPKSHFGVKSCPCFALNLNMMICYFDILFQLTHDFIDKIM
jgi:hypothetical protein